MGGKYTQKKQKKKTCCTISVGKKKKKKVESMNIALIVHFTPRTLREARGAGAV